MDLKVPQLLTWRRERMTDGRARRSPVRDGKLKAMHCMEIPFVFDHVDDCRGVVGSGGERYALAGKMSHAWVAFARTGNPNDKALPHWAPYTAAQRATMIFDNECQVVKDHRREERVAPNNVKQEQAG